MIEKSRKAARLMISGFLLVAGVLAGTTIVESSEPTVAGAAPLLHLRLVSTSPAADTVLTTSPAEIRLVFSEAPQSGGSTVRLTRGAEDLVASSETTADPQDARQLVIRPDAPLTAGAYMVHWRVLAEDGHAQRGTFEFRVAAE